MGLAPRLQCHNTKGSKILGYSSHRLSWPSICLPFSIRGGDITDFNLHRSQLAEALRYRLVQLSRNET